MLFIKYKIGLNKMNIQKENYRIKEEKGLKIRAEKRKINRQVIDLIFIFIIAMILMIPQFSPKADIYLDDGSQHLMRAYGTYQTMLQNGNC